MRSSSRCVSRRFLCNLGRGISSLTTLFDLNMHFGENARYLKRNYFHLYFVYILDMLSSASAEAGTFKIKSCPRTADCNSQGAWRRKEEVTTCADSPRSFFSSPDDYMCCQPSFFCFCSSSTAAEPDPMCPVSYSLLREREQGLSDHPLMTLSIYLHLPTLSL